MANRRFIDFPIASTVGDSDIILIWQGGANKQTTKATFLSGLPENLNELNDVTISGLTNGQILRYDSVTGKWENTDQGNLDLNDLNDVSIVSPSNGQVLVYNSSTSKWENSSGGYVPYTGAVTTVNLGAQTIQAGQFVKAGGTAAQFLKADGSVDSTAYGTGSVTSVALTMPSAFNVANSPITTAGTLAVTGAGNVGQYIRGDGSLADFPQASGGGSSVSYYLNGSISQGTIGGVAYKELNKVPILGAGTDFTINADGYIASFLTDAGDPNLLEIPGGNWNFETYFSASSSGGTPTFYVELYKYDGTTFTLIASSSTSPELIAFGTNLNPYFSTLAVPTTTLALTDRLAIRYYVTHSGRTITLHTENNHLCQVVTTFTTGLTSLNGLTAQVQNLAVGTSGTDFNIASATATHTFNLPTASATNRGALSSADWTTFNNKQNALGYVPVPETRTITINGVSQDLSANRTYNVGTVTSVGLSSATSGVTIGGSPVTGVGAFTLAIATASGSQNGLLSSTDWTTFNNKQNALTNPVTGTGTTNYLPKFTGSTTIGNSQIFDNGSGVGIGGTNTDSLLTINGSAGTTHQRFREGSTTIGFIGGANGLITGQSGKLTVRAEAGLVLSSQGNSPDVLITSGNLLVGTTTDNGARLQVSGGLNVLSTYASDIAAQSVLRDNTGVALNFGGTASGFKWLQAQDSTGAATYYNLLLNPYGGSVGIGTTSPKTFTGTTLGALQVGTSWVGTFAASSSFGTILGNNVYYNSDWKRTLAQPVSFIQFNEDNFYFANAATGAADSTFTPITRMAITSGGNVGIGTPSPAKKLDVYENSTASVAQYIRNTTVNGLLQVDGTSNFQVGTETNHPLFLLTNNATRVLITGSGNVLIGTTTNGSSKLRLVGLPTSSAGLSSGDVYSDSGTLKIA